MEAYTWICRDCRHAVVAPSHTEQEFGRIFCPNCGGTCDPNVATTRRLARGRLAGDRLRRHHESCSWAHDTERDQPPTRKETDHAT